MKSGKIFSNAGLLLCCLSVMTITLASDGNGKESLLGKWVYEEATVADPEDPISYDLYNDYVKLYAEIEFEEGSASFTYSENTQKVKYTVDGNQLTVEFPLGETFSAGWKVVGNQLFLEFDSFHPNNREKDAKVVVVYRKVSEK